jgi:flagellar biosynthesis/type III secretory pathway protein FliH
LTYLADKAAEIAKFTVEQADNYEENLKVYRDLKNSLDTAIEEGMEKGYKKGVEKGKEIGIKESKIE